MSKTPAPKSKPKAKAKKVKATPRKTRKRSFGVGAIFRFLLYWGVVAAVWGLILLVGVLVWYAYDLPDVSHIAETKQQPKVTLLSHDGREMASFGDLYGESVPLTQLPSYLPKAVIATEDRRFYDHFGLDVFGLTRAMYVNLKAGRIVQGGSTITQQLAKNLFLTPARTIKRKAQEVLLALWLESNFSKDEIMTLYLNRVYLGGGTYGVEAASRKYFNKSARKISLAEAVMLAGLLKAPSRYAPTTNLKTAQNRSKIVLASMVDAGLLTKKLADQTAKAPARLRPGAAGQRQTRFFADWVLSRVPQFVNHAVSDLTVVTTLDLRLQRLARIKMRQAHDANARKLNAQQGALVTMSPNGAVRAMIGGRNYNQSQFNRATRAKRQPGSAFKPIVYLAGLEAGLRPDSVLPDRRVTISGWSPKNYSGRFEGNMTLTTALAKSVNTVAAQVMQIAGAERVQDAALRLGVTSDIPGHPSVSLGTAEVSLLELTTAYAAFASGGRAAIAHGIVEIRDKSGRVLYRRSGGGGTAASGRLAAQMNAMLQQVITRGTGKAARLGKRPVAGKTGTSQDYRDAWFVGYTAQYVTGVWFGNDDGEPMKRVTGSGLPARTWRSYMQDAHKGLKMLAFAEAPAGAEMKSLLDRLLGGVRNLGGGGGDRSDSTPRRLPKPGGTGGGSDGNQPYEERPSR